MSARLPTGFSATSRTPAAVRSASRGSPHCDWVLVDAGDVIVHLFRPDVRTFYNIEKMWLADQPAGPIPV